ALRAMHCAYGDAAILVIAEAVAQVPHLPSVVREHEDLVAAAPRLWQLTGPGQEGHEVGDDSPVLLVRVGAAPRMVGPGAERRRVDVADRGATEQLERTCALARPHL